MQDYTKLRVWSKAVSVAINVRRATSRFPRTGYAELKAQTVSAAESVVANIVEGCGSSTQREFARYLGIAIKSAMEVEGHLRLARSYGIISPEEWHSRSAEIIETRKMLYALRKKVEAPASVPRNDRYKSISPPPPTTQTHEPVPPEPTVLRPARVHDPLTALPPPPQTR